MDLNAQIARAKELMHQRDAIDKELTQFKELVAILKPPQKRRKKKEQPAQNVLKMGA